MGGLRLWYDSPYSHPITGHSHREVLAMVRTESSKGDGTPGQDIETLRVRFAGEIEAIGRVTQSWDLDTVCFRSCEPLPAR